MLHGMRQAVIRITFYGLSICVLVAQCQKNYLQSNPGVEKLIHACLCISTTEGQGYRKPWPSGESLNNYYRKPLLPQT